MKRLAIAVIHGLSSEDEFYSVELKHRITEQYLKSGEGHTHFEDDLLFHEIYWGDLLKQEMESFRKKANYKKDLTYQNLREILTDTQVLSLLYVPGTAFYQAINNRIKDGLRKFSAHSRVDSEHTPLVILAHSYGAVMMSDYIRKMQQDSQQRSNFESMKTLAGYVTFGNPMALYSLNNVNSELGMPFNIVGEALAPHLQKLAKWYNFYDKDDIIAYPLKGISEQFDQYVHADIEINVGNATTSWNPACHTGYWEDKDFFRPVADFIYELRAPHPFWKS